MPKLTIVRGLPGSGKSTYAKSLNVYHLESDMYLMIDGKYQWTPERMKEGHLWVTKQFYAAVKEGIDIVISNTFTQLWEFEIFLNVGEGWNYDIEVVKCCDDFGNTHDVPEETLKKMADRWEDFDGEELVYLRKPK